MSRVTIRIGGYTLAICKASHSRDDVVAAATSAAREHGYRVLIKRRHDGRWQAFAHRCGPRGQRYPGDYDYSQCRSGGDVRARKRTTTRDGRVYFLPRAGGSGAFRVAEICS